MLHISTMWRKIGKHIKWTCTLFLMFNSDDPLNVLNCLYTFIPIWCNKLGNMLWLCQMKFGKWFQHKRQENIWCCMRIWENSIDWNLVCIFTFYSMDRWGSCGNSCWRVLRNKSGKSGLNIAVAKRLSDYAHDPLEIVVDQNVWFEETKWNFHMTVLCEDK